MPAPKSSFLDKVLDRITRLDTAGLQTVVERLARERTFLETLFNTIEDGVLVVDENGRVTYFNQAVTRLLGAQPDAEDLHIGKLLPDLDWQKLAAMDAAGGQRVVRQELEVDYPRPRFLRLYAAPLDGAAPGAGGVALILNDATEARQKTFETIESERIHALTLLAASVAHEIGNPLNALHIHLQLMERELKKLRQSSGELPSAASVVTSRPRSHARAVRNETQEILGKLDSYLDVAKGEITRLDYIITEFLQAIRPSPPQLKPSSLNEVIEETVNLLRPELENRGLLLKHKLARVLPSVPMDAAQIKQVLVNLIKNAMQAMSKGGVIALQTGDRDDGVWVSITDTGGGIPPEELNRIFEPFYTTKKKGSGLGLMIVQRIVREHGGKIDLESNVGKGTTFRIWLPPHQRRMRLLGAPMPEKAKGGASD